VRGRCERLLVTGCVLGLLAVPAIAESKKQHGGNAPDQSTGGGAPPDQMDFFQGLSLGSNKEPIHINSDSLVLDYKGSVLTYSGNVKVTQADVTLTSDQLAITYDRQAVQRSPAPDSTSSPAAAPAVARSPGVMPAPTASPAQRGGGADKIKEVVAEGHVRIQRGDRVAEGRRAVFDQVKQTIVLSDGAVLHEGANRVAGDRIIVYLQEQRSVVESGSNSRVSAVFYPNANPSGRPSSSPTPSGAAAVRSPDVRLGAASGAPTDGGR
jgi:lipopolysaccharide export system protein LptA